MNNKAQLDFEDINPFSVLLAILGGFFAFWITGNPFGFGGEENVVNSVGMFWRIAAGVLTMIVAFFIVQAMAD